ncbi:MAG: hypothetical protein P8189_07105 [Anaerolineae bacterium]
MTVGVEVAVEVEVAVGVAVAVDVAVGVGAEVAVGSGVLVAAGIAEGSVVEVAEGTIATSVGVDPEPHAASDTMINIRSKPRSKIRSFTLFLLKRFAVNLVV